MRIKREYVEAIRERVRRIEALATNPHWTTSRKHDIGNIAIQILNMLPNEMAIEGICPVCGERIKISTDRTTDGRLIGSCEDAFTVEKWEEE